jgi:hypothetical protein
MRWKGIAECYAVEIERVGTGIDNIAESLRATRPNLSNLPSMHKDDDVIVKPAAPSVIYESLIEELIQVPQESACNLTH